MKQVSQVQVLDNVARGVVGPCWAEVVVEVYNAHRTGVGTTVAQLVRVFGKDAFALGGATYRPKVPSVVGFLRTQSRAFEKRSRGRTELGLQPLAAFRGLDDAAETLGSEVRARFALEGAVGAVGHLESVLRDASKVPGASTEVVRAHAAVREARTLLGRPVGGEDLTEGGAQAALKALRACIPTLARFDRASARALRLDNGTDPDVCKPGGPFRISEALKFLFLDEEQQRREAIVWRTRGAIEEAEGWEATPVGLCETLQEFPIGA